MLVAIDARLVSAQDMGSSVYCRSLLRALPACSGGHEYRLICGPSAGAKVRLGPGLRWVERPGARLMDEAWEQLSLPELLQELKPDVYLSLSSVLPAAKTCPQVTIIHDTAIEDEPGFYETGLFRYLGKWLRAAAAQAALILTVSHHAKGSIQRAYGVPPERVVVACPAADEIFWPIPENEERDDVLGAYGVEGLYLITVASLAPNKNVGAVLEAYHLAGARAGTGHALVLAGGAGSAEPGLRRQISQLGLGDDIVLTGHVPRDHLPSLYSAVTCFLWPSLYEGFGLPALEAMACGTPVVSSNRTAMPEVLAGAAILVDPCQPHAIASALKLVLSNEQLRQRLRQAGLRRAAQFSWQQTARQTVQCLERIAEGG